MPALSLSPAGLRCLAVATAALALAGCLGPSVSGITGSIGAMTAAPSGPVPCSVGAPVEMVISGSPTIMVSPSAPCRVATVPA